MLVDVSKKQKKINDRDFGDKLLFSYIFLIHNAKDSETLTRNRKFSVHNEVHEGK